VSLIGEKAGRDFLPSRPKVVPEPRCANQKPGRRFGRPGPAPQRHRNPPTRNSKAVRQAITAFIAQDVALSQISDCGDDNRGRHSASRPSEIGADDRVGASGRLFATTDRGGLLARPGGSADPGAHRTAQTRLSKRAVFGREHPVPSKYARVPCPKGVAKAPGNVLGLFVWPFT
jgi:hypothetical protein